MSTIVAAWADRIRSDLSPFIDPSTALEISCAGSVIDAVWLQRRKARSARFVVKDSEGIYVVKDGEELTYRSFFASEDMADISGIAQTSRDVLGGSIFVETRASSDDVKGAEDVPATELISAIASKRIDSDVLTNFVMVTGEAGAGKTWVLKELVRRQARRYLAAESDFVFLYVNAQGRALSRFNEALSTELNELRVALPHGAVAAMVRMGLIVPVIDGFDELIGVGGYDDAFSSISSFVSKLEGAGAIVASARSTYYEQEFLSRSSRNAARSLDAWKLSSVSVHGWTINERRTYVTSKLSDNSAEKRDAVLAALNKVFSGENEELGRKPLFVARATDLLLAGLLEVRDGGLVERLVDAFALRELNEKLLKKDGGSILSERQILDICSDIAEEMWNLSSRELEGSSAKEVAEVAIAGAGLTPADQAIVVERVPSMAFLQPGDSAGTVQFEHEIFFDYFLARRMADAVISNSPSLPMLLSRSAMAESLADTISKRLVDNGTNAVSDIIDRLCGAAAKMSPKQQLVKENSGQLIGCIAFRARDVRNVRLYGLVFPGSTFHGVRFTDCVIEYCNFRRCDLTSATFTSCSSVGASFDSPLVDSDTRLNIDGLDLRSFSGLRMVGDETIRVIYDPKLIVDYLSKAGIPGAEEAAKARLRPVDADVVHLVERLARAYAKCNPICVQDENLYGIFDAYNWPSIQKLAIESGLLKLERRAANGPRRDFLRRLVRSEDMISGAMRGADVPDEVNDFWRMLERDFPAK